jgi:hypothetical protein
MRLSVTEAQALIGGLIVSGPARDVRDVNGPVG